MTALAAAGLVGAAPASAASGLDAAAIDAFLLAQGSPMAGCGARFVAKGDALTVLGRCDGFYKINVLLRGCEPVGE